MKLPGPLSRLGLLRDYDVRPALKVMRDEDTFRVTGFAVGDWMVGVLRYGKSDPEPEPLLKTYDGPITVGSGENQTVAHHGAACPQVLGTGQCNCLAVAAEMKDET